MMTNGLDSIETFLRSERCYGIRTVFFSRNHNPGDIIGAFVDRLAESGIVHSENKQKATEIFMNMLVDAREYPNEVVARLGSDAGGGLFDHDQTRSSQGN